MVEPSKWDWADALAGVAMGIITGILSLFSWFSGKVGLVHQRLDAMQDKVADHGTSIRVLEAQHHAKLQRLDRIEESVMSINEKQDRQMEILMDIRNK